MRYSEDSTGACVQVPAVSAHDIVCPCLTFNAVHNAESLLVGVTLQRELAALLIEANSRHSTKDPNESILSQVSNVYKLQRLTSCQVLPSAHWNEQQRFTQWCWSVIMEQHLRDAAPVDANSTNWMLPLRQAPNEPLTAYAMLMMCQEGFHYDFFQGKGLALLETILQISGFEAVLRALYHIVPAMVLVGTLRISPSDWL